MKMSMCVVNYDDVVVVAVIRNFDVGKHELTLPLHHGSASAGRNLNHFEIHYVPLQNVYLKDFLNVYSIQVSFMEYPSSSYVT